MFTSSSQIGVAISYYENWRWDVLGKPGTLMQMPISLANGVARAMGFIFG